MNQLTGNDSGSRSSQTTGQNTFDRIDAEKMSKLSNEPIQPGTSTTSSAVSDVDRSDANQMSTNNETPAGKEQSEPLNAERIDQGSNESFPASDVPASHRSV